MGPLEALLILDEVLPALFPDRSASMIRIAERWLWFDSVPARSPPGDEGTRVFPEAILCDWCGRTGDFVRCLVGLHEVTRSAEAARWPAELFDYATRRGNFHICRACSFLAREPGQDEVVLADIERALGSHEDGPEALTELRRAATNPRIPKPARKERCTLCHQKALAGAAPLFLCGPCLARIGSVPPRTGGLRESPQPVQRPAHSSGETASFPFLWIPGAVPFPGTELWIEQHGELAAARIQQALGETGEIVFASGPRPPRTGADLPSIATVAKIIGGWDEVAGGVVRGRDPNHRLAGLPYPDDPRWLMLVIGTQRIQVTGLRHERIEGIALEEDDDHPGDDWSDYHAMTDAYQRFSTAHIDDEDRLWRVMRDARLNHATWLMANAVPATGDERLALLQELDLRKRAAAVRRLVEREIDAGELESRIVGGRPGSAPTTSDEIDR